MSKKIRTTWGKIFENTKLMLFNEYPGILFKCGAEDELYQFSDSLDESDDIFQWYIIDASEIEWLERFCPNIAKDIHWSETIGNYIMAVRHYGTGWDAVLEELEIKDKDIENFYEFYKKIYHDDLPDWVKRNVFNEKGVNNIYI